MRGQSILSRSSSHKLEQLFEEGTAKGWGWGKFIPHTIRDSHYCREKGAENIVGGNGSKHIKGMINYQPQKFTPLGLVSWVTIVIYSTPEEGEMTVRYYAPGAFIVSYLHSQIGSCRSLRFNLLLSPPNSGRHTAKTSQEFPSLLHWEASVFRWYLSKS